VPWNDPIARAYKQAYFARFPGLWHHSDFAEWTEIIPRTPP